MKQAKVLTDAELKRVLSICVTMQNGKRNRLMLLLSHYAGMRVGEIASLKWADVLDREMKPKAMFYLKAENTKAKEARQVHMNAKLKREWRAPIGGSGLIVSASWASGLLVRCFPARVVGSPERCVA